MSQTPATTRKTFPEISSRAWEHPADRTALSALRRLKGFDQILKLMSGMLRERQHRLLYLASAARVGPRQFADLDALLDECVDVVFALAFHHLPPTVACKAIAEATRVGKRFLIIDLKRQKPLSFTLSSVLLLPLHLLLLPWSSMRSSMHDGFISALRAYTPSALQTLARAADPGMQVEILPAPTRLFPPSLAVVFSRSSSAPTESSECSADRQPGE